MKVIQNGFRFNIYDNSMINYDFLPPQAYQLEYSREEGTYLRKHPNIEINEKVYGVHTEKVTKILNSFKNFKRNLGVILSGDKGIGKSLFSKMLSIEAIKLGYPLIIISNYVPGISDFLNSIDQEVVVLFDEFDKMFPEDSQNSTQNSLLSLFDGLSSGKKLFIITCNYLNKLNEFLVNRPGRFHYHIRFEYPSSNDIFEYLNDNILDPYKEEINNIIAFSKMVQLNFDCLRSIVFEINQGLTLSEALKDLNIMNLNSEKYNLKCVLSNGRVLSRNVQFSLFKNSKTKDRTAESHLFYDSCPKNFESILFSNVKFNVDDFYYDEKLDIVTISNDKLIVKTIIDDWKEFIEETGLSTYKELENYETDFWYAHHISDSEMKAVIMFLNENKDITVDHIELERVNEISSLAYDFSNKVR